MALVLYRKYRPKSFAELVGQEHVVTTLTNALTLDRVGHAYLFVGPRGTGKTTVARLLAKAVNCENKTAKGDACNTCIQCQSFLQMRHPDLVEVDAASNRGIDEIRDLREGARVAPMQGTRKVYVIDEAHMLTSAAVNALLKTLEEPPEHAMFMLATTDVEKLPVTILSRCQRFDFRLLAIPEIMGRLSGLAEAEGAVIDEDAIDLLAQAADGSLRDGESLLEQVLAFLGKQASRDEVTRLLGIPDPLVVRDIAGAMLLGNTKEALEAVNAAVDHGADATTLATRLASYLRDVLLLNADQNLYSIIEKRSGAAHAQGALVHAEQANQQQLMHAVPKAIDAIELTKRSPIPQLPIEMLIVEMTSGSPNENEREESV